MFKCINSNLTQKKLDSERIFIKAKNCPKFTKCDCCLDYFGKLCKCEVMENWAEVKVRAWVIQRHKKSMTQTACEGSSVTKLTLHGMRPKWENLNSCDGADDGSAAGACQSFDHGGAQLQWIGEETDRFVLNMMIIIVIIMVIHHHNDYETRPARRISATWPLLHQLLITASHTDGTLTSKIISHGHHHHHHHHHHRCHHHRHHQEHDQAIPTK